MAGLLFRIGRFAARRRWLVIVTWVVIVALAGVGYSLFEGPTSPSISIPGTATQAVQDELADKFPKISGGTGSLVFESTDGSPFTSAQKTAISSFLTTIEGEDGVRATTDPFATQAQLDGERQKVQLGRQQLVTGREQLTIAQTKLDEGKAQLAAGQGALDAARAQAVAAGQLAAAQGRLAAEQAQIDAGRAKLAAGQATTDMNTATLDAQSQQLEVGSQLLDLAKNFRVVSSDSAAAVGTVQFTTSTIKVDPAVKAFITEKSAAGLDGVDVFVSNDISQGVPSILGPGEVVGVVVAGLVLLLMLGTVIGAALPLVSAIVGLGAATLGSMAFSGVVEFNSVTVVLGVMLGLAVGIDYSLFILNRHRRQLRQGIGLSESIGLANGTSGNAVVFAGFTVIVALVAMNITGVPFLGLMGTVGAVAVALAILVATSFTPAVLSLIGFRILRKKERTNIGHADIARVPDRPMNTGRAILTLIAGVAVLGVIALPATTMRLGLPVGSSEATDSSQYKAYKVIEAKFGAGQNGPLVVVADLPSAVTEKNLTSTELMIAQKIGAQKNVRVVVPIGTSNDNTVIAFQVIPKEGPQSVSTETLVHDLRGLSPLTSDAGEIRLGVAGNASANIDVSEKLANALPLYLLVVVGLSLLILILVFRSILVPLTATAGFVLSLLATFGGLTAIYQWGWLGAFFGVHDPAPILSFLPVIVVGVLFGLAMDYQLFLVSGMREAFVHGASAKVAVQRGLYAGRAVVAAAAIIMVSVFSGFIFAESATVRPIGFALAFGVLVDAFIVRMLLIPAAMHLLGSSAWWFPRWLDRIVPDVDVEGAALERAHPRSQAPAEEMFGSRTPVA